MTPEEAGLRHLLDVEAVKEVVLRYCRGIDRLDLDLVRSCYHPDATDTHGAFTGTIDEYLEWVEGLLARYDATFHMIGNHVVDFGESASGGHPDVAVSEAYGVAHHRATDPDPRRNLTVGFRFIDRMERRDGTWRIARRVATTEWVTSNPTTDRWPLPDTGLGRRGHDDPLHEALSELHRPADPT